MAKSRAAAIAAVAVVLIAGSQPGWAQQLTEQQREVLRRKAEEARERNRREREEIQKNFAPTNAVAAPVEAKAPPSAPPKTFDPRNPCDGDFDTRIEKYRRWKPSLNPQLSHALNTGLYIGMPLDMFRIFTCESVKDYHITTTAAGESIQYVMHEYSVGFGKYVYFHNGVLTAIQR